MDVSALIEDYGAFVYVALFYYCLLKSGSLPLLAGYAAQSELLDLTLVLLATFGGGYLGDEARFAAARRFGVSWITRWPTLRRALDASNRLIDRYGIAYIFLYRYPKGMRTIGAFPVGLGSMAWRAFTVFNALSALLWTAVLVGVGYIFGEQVEQAALSGWGLVSALMLVALVFAVGFAWRRMNRIALG